MDRTGTERSAALRLAKSADPSVVAEVEELLAAHGRRAGFMEQPAVKIDGMLTRTDTNVAGSRVGAYRLVHLVGEGGMGEVWCAEQEFPLKRRVAVKLIKSGMDSREVVARFQSERQALALMEHPAIAQVFDAGSTADGRPYFAMEYVAGVPITQYCDQHQLSIRDRLKIFMLVCEGVQHAHQKAIIHRDLKPSNILVTEVDGRPVPKIIDFGVARAKLRRPEIDLALTQAGVVLGTPKYMSPEQAHSAGEDIDTRSDVYSLGVILYELLVGAMPFDLKNASFGEFLRTLRDSDAPRPSARFRLLAEQSTRAANRRTEPEKLIRQLRGDLDAITLNALEKERSRRYDTASALAADLDRHLRNKPVSARPANLGYRAGKLVRRHSTLAAMFTLLTILLVSFGIVEAVQLRRTTRERDRADRIANFMIGMFHVSDPSESRGNQITAREILDKGSANILSGLASDSQMQAQMMAVMGSVYSNLGLYRQAEVLLDRTLRIRRRVLGSKNPLTADSVSALADVLRLEGRLTEATALDREGFQMRQRLLGPEHPDTLRSMNNMARDLVNAGRYGEAEQVHRTVLEIRRRVLGEEHPDTLTSMDNLGNTLDDEGRYREAELLERRALEIRRRLLGEDHPDTLRSVHHLADTLYGVGRYAEAAKLHREEWNVARRVLGPEHRNTLNAMVALANALDDQGKYLEAESLERHAIEVFSRVLGAENPDTLLAKNNLAEILADEGRYQEAARLHREVVAVRSKVLGPEHSDTLYSKSKLAWALMLSGGLDEAEKLSREARVGQARVLGPDHPDTAETTYNLASIAAQRGRTAEALADLKSAIDHGLKPRALLRISRDSSLRSLHRKPEFQGLLLEARRRLSAAGAW